MKVLLICPDEQSVSEIRRFLDIPAEWMVVVEDEQNEEMAARTRSLRIDGMRPVYLLTTDATVISLAAAGRPMELALARVLGPPFQPRGNLVHVDITQLCNMRMDGDFDCLGRQNNLSEFPRGRQVFGGVTFQVGDELIQLAPELAWRNVAAQKAVTIPINRSFARLYALHGAQWANVEDGIGIGSIQVRHKNRAVQTIPIVVGENVRDWWCLERSMPTSHAVIAWEGQNTVSRQENRMIRVYLIAWENPLPNSAVDHLEFQLAENGLGGPFLIALTLEESLHTSGE